MKVVHPHISNLSIQFDDFYARGQFSNALEVAQTIFLEAEKIQSFEIKLSTYVKQMQCFYGLGEIENAFDSILKLRLLCEGITSPKIDYYIHMINGYIYDYEENYPLAIVELEKAIAFAFITNEEKAIASSRNVYAHILLKDNQINEAYQIATTNYEYIQNHLPSNVLIQCQVQHILATIQIEKGLLDDAYAVLQLLATNPLIAFNSREKSRYFFAIATYYEKNKQYDLAIRHFKKSEKIAFKSNDTMLLKRIYKMYANIYAHQNNFKNAYLQMQNYTHLLEQTIRLNFSSKINELHIKQTSLHLERKANFDSLSGLYNRSYIEQICNQWLGQAKINDDNIYMAILDVDNFKKINDSYGHIYGDEVIKFVGTCCKVLSNESDCICARYGGDEFIIILKNTDEERARKIIHQVYEKITSETLLINDQQIHISISIGVANSHSFPSSRFIQLFRIADQALYAAKNQGKNQIIEMQKQ